MVEIVDKIFEVASRIGRDVNIMEVCGGHTNVIMKYGIRDILPKSVNLISGPGCPVCVTSQRDIDCMIALARAGVKIATYGDMLYVRGTSDSLADAKREGADILVVYSVMELLAEEGRDRVFFGIGFETTTPMSAFLLEKGVCVFSVHKLMPPAMREVVRESNIDGFLDPGHVSCVMGFAPFEELGVSQVVCGFERFAILKAIYRLLLLIERGERVVVNDYDEVVSVGGNLKAKRLVEKHFRVCGMEWRGFGVIPGSGLVPRDNSLDAREVYSKVFEKVESQESLACLCPRVIRGVSKPEECKLFGKGCTPQKPFGACMVSEEGSCNIAYRFKR